MIRKIFDLEEDFENVDCYIDGITDYKWDPFSDPIHNLQCSRGEFVGYYWEPRSLSLFRDRVGARNLYYHISNRKVYVSTDLLWIVEQINPSLNLNYIEYQYIPFQVPFTRDTIYNNIKKVMPGEILTLPVYASGPWESGKSEKYWQLKFGNARFSPGDLQDLIIDAVNWRKNIIGDSPYCSALSGGIDSSSITMLAKPSETFSGFYDQEQYSELFYITTVLDALGQDTRGFKVKILEETFHKLLPSLPLIMPDPMGGLGVIPQTIISMIARKHGFRHIFTGEGGDEIFYGYPWNTLLIETARKIRGLARDKYMIRWESMLEKFLSSSLFPGMIALIARERSVSIDELWKWDDSQCVENNIMKFMIDVSLPAILTVDECVGKYTGVMPISPLVDHRIIEYVASIAPEERTKIPKYLLRQSMEEIVPREVLSRHDKMGFPVPVDKWKWPMLQDLIPSFRKRRIEGLPTPVLSSDIMDRHNWGIVNLELICRMLEKTVTCR